MYSSRKALPASWYWGLKGCRYFCFGRWAQEISKVRASGWEDTYSGGTMPDTAGARVRMPRARAYSIIFLVNSLCPSRQPFGNGPRTPYFMGSKISYGGPE